MGTAFERRKKVLRYIKLKLCRETLLLTNKFQDHVEGGCSQFDSMIRTPQNGDSNGS